MIKTPGKSVLIVDDEVSARKTVRMILKDLYRCLLARGYHEALDILAREKIDVAILDYNLGRGKPNGIELLSEMQKLELPTDVIIVSGTKLSGLKRTTIDMGARIYLEKPVDNQQLIKAVEFFATR